MCFDYKLLFRVSLIKVNKDKIISQHPAIATAPLHPVLKHRLIGLADKGKCNVLQCSADVYSDWTSTKLQTLAGSSTSLVIYGNEWRVFGFWTVGSTQEAICHRCWGTPDEYFTNQLAVAAQALTEHYGRYSDKVNQIKWSLNRGVDGMFVETRFQNTHLFSWSYHTNGHLANISFFNLLDFGWDTNDLISAVHSL